MKTLQETVFERNPDWNRDARAEMHWTQKQGCYNKVFDSLKIVPQK